MTKIQNDNKIRTLGDKYYTDTPWLNEAVTQTSTFTTNSTTYQDITNMSISLTLERAISVLVLFTMKFDTGTDDFIFAKGILDVDSTDKYPEVWGGAYGRYNTRSSHNALDLTAGSHTIKLKLKSSSAGGYNVSTLAGTNLSVIELHK